jgi:Flp pilus assembly protein TadD
MITTSGVLLDEDLKETAPTGGFRVQPPTSNPLVAASGLSLLMKDDKVSIEWDQEKPALTGDLLTRMRQEFISRSRKDVAKHPNSARAHTNLGITLMNQGELEEAVREFELALSIDPHHYVAGITLAKIKVEQGQLDEAEKLYSELKSAFPDESAPILSLAFIAMKKFDFGTAEHLLRDAVALLEDMALPKYHLAMVLLRLGKCREAISLLKGAVRSEVRSPTLYQALGVAYAIGGDKSRAELNFRTALTLAPNLSEAVHGLARVLIEQGKASQALSLLVDHLDKMADDDQARELLARAYYGVGQYGSAAQHVVQLFSHLPEEAQDAATIERKAYLAAEIGSYFVIDRKDKQAETWLLRAIRLAPNRDAGPYLNLGRLYFRSDRNIEALRVLSDCKRLFPEQQDTHELIAWVCAAEGFYDEALQELEPLVKAGNAGASIYSALGCVLDFKGDASNAERVLREGYEKYPGERGIIHNLSYILLMNHKVEEGRRMLERYRDILEQYARENTTYDAVLTATWGLVHLLEGKRDVGVQLYKQAAKSASRVGDRDLGGAVLQKMHIEVAKLLLKEGDTAAAKREIAAGLLIKRGREPYRRELKLLQASLNNAQKAY